MKAISTKLITAGVLLVLAFYAITNCVELLDAKHVMVIQYPTGSLAAFTEPGPKMQWFGTITKYERRAQYSFDTHKEVCKNGSSDGYAPIVIRFAEGGHATLCGALSWEMPTSPEKLFQIQKDFASQGAVEQQLVAKALVNAIYFSGQMMTSTESSAERRAELLQYIEDQIRHGVYQTQTRQERQKDPLTGVERTIAIVELVKKDGVIIRNAKSAIADYGITLVQTAISEIKYEKTVEDQIQQQQKAKTEVQIAIAQAKKAEQDAITIAKQGEATAAKSKWEQETIKAREVTKAEQEKAVAITEAEKNREVAKLGKEAAEFTKLREIALGQGESERRRLVMSADGALEKKLDAWLKAQEYYATAIKEYKGAWVPQTVMGASAGGGANGGLALIELLTAKTARDLSLDMKVPGQK